MFEGCNPTTTTTVCPKCQHQFECPGLAHQLASSRRCLLSGGGLVQTTTTSSLSYPHHHHGTASSPEVSPSQPIIFVLPPFHLIQHPQQEIVNNGHHHHLHQPIVTSAPEHTVRALQECGWYYQGITYQESQELLKDKEVGTFLVRDSSDPRYLYSLSVRTERGPTSVRLHFADQKFKLEAEVHLQAAMPAFDSVLALVEHYVHQSRHCKSGGAHVWVDSHGKRYSPIVLLKPLVKEGEAPSLKHLSRLAVQRSIGKRVDRLEERHLAVGRLELPVCLRQYLAEYPYSI